MSEVPCAFMDTFTTFKAMRREEKLLGVPIIYTNIWRHFASSPRSFVFLCGKPLILVKHAQHYNAPPVIQPRCSTSLNNHGRNIQLLLRRQDNVTNLGPRDSVCAKGFPNPHWLDYLSHAAALAALLKSKPR